MSGISAVPESFVFRGTETKMFAYANIINGSIKVWRKHPEALGNNTLYAEDTDYEIDYTNGTIKRLTGSNIPDATNKADPIPGSYSDATTGNINYQVWVEYQRYGIRAARPKNTKLTHFMNKIKTNDAVSVTIIGDSISNGGEAEVASHIFWNVWKRVLEANFSIAVQIDEQAVGGEDSSSLTTENLTTRVTGTPDLVMIGFGMNDQSSLSASAYQTNIQTAITWIKTNFPDADILLISGCLPNYATFYDTEDKARFDSYLPVLQTLAMQDNVALADVTTEWQRFLERKTYHDLLRNDINHPTSFGHMEVYYRVLSDFIPINFI